MRRLIATTASLIVATALMAAPVGAISGGTPDGDAHPSVGAMLYRESGATDYTIGCTGTLIGPRVFLTAGHCAFYMEYFLPAGTEYVVSFDTDLGIGADGLADPEHVIPVDDWAMMPTYRFQGSASPDVSVLFLASAPAGLDPVALPPVGAAEGSVGELVVNVGYGWTSLDRSPSSPRAEFTADGLRRTGTSWVSGVSPNQLVAHRGPASTCYHDSGGPQFLDGVLVAITHGGDSPCVDLQTNQRIDLADVLAWLGEQLD